MVSACCQMGWFYEAHHLLDEMLEPNLVSYNSIISGLIRHGFYGKSIHLSRNMQREFCRNELWLDECTLVHLMRASACLGALKLLNQVHGLAIARDSMTNLVVCNTLIASYGKCREPFLSYKVFGGMSEKDVVSWTSMVVAYVQSRQLVDAWHLFNLMPVRNVVSWTTLISGFAQNGEGEMSLSLFVQMQKEGIIPNATTYVSVLGACADLPLIERGKQLHGHIIRWGSAYVGVTDTAYVTNSLINMYCKSGNMDYAIALFKRFRDKDVVTWNSVITGFAYNGQAERSLALYKAMIERNVKPNSVTFLGVLAACSHKGLLHQGLQIFHQMKREFSIDPESDHYSIIIDLLGRQNQLVEAAELIEDAPGSSDHIGMWGALLGACQVHANTELGKIAADILLNLEPENAARYVILSNIYNAAGWRDDADKVRRLKYDQGLRKEEAYSWIEVKNTSHKFVSLDNSHEQIEEIKELLHKLVDQLKDA